jgi:Ca-activated chloride channel family protein
MSLTWPWALLALLAFPLLLGFRWWMRRRRRRSAVLMSSVTLIRAALPGRSPWRRRIPLWLFACGLVVLAVGAARPQASVRVPSDSSSILLAIDVSGSMCSTDVAPNRLTAAENAARDFIKAQHNGTKIGLVVFTGIAALQVAPTTDKDALLAAVGSLRTSRGTAIGLGILTAIDAIAEINPDVAPTGVDLPASPAGTEYEPDTIVVLTDGANTQGVEPQVAAVQAAARGIRVYTIGFGTTNPSQPVCNIDQIGRDRPGDVPFDVGGPVGAAGGGPGGRRFLVIDEPTLQAVAETTGGRYFRAEDAAQLDDVFRNLPSEVVTQHEREELTVWFVLVAAIFAAAAMALSLAWNRYP